MKNLKILLLSILMGLFSITACQDSGREEQSGSSASVSSINTSSVSDTAWSNSDDSTLSSSSMPLDSFETTLLPM